MELRTKINAEENRQDLVITRDFDLPVDLLFTAYVDPEIVEQWMGSKVLKLENRKHGSYQFEKRDPQDNVLFRANGVIHDTQLNRSIIRTFEMEGAPFGVQLEFLTFEERTEETSRLTMHIVFRSAELRDQMLKLPFAAGLNMAHNRLQEILNKHR